MKKISYLLICLLGISIGLLIGRKMSGPAEIKEIEVSRTDTLTIVQTDTVRIVKPQPYEVVVRDTVYLQYPQNPQYPQGDVLVQEVKTYKDSSYTATISGINAYLEHIEVYPKTVTKYITTTEFVREKPKKWGIGIQAGYGIGRNGLQPYVGVGVSYNLIRF